jgi:hypothetical protein
MVCAFKTAPSDKANIAISKALSDHMETIQSTRNRFVSMSWSMFSAKKSANFLGKRSNGLTSIAGRAF